MIGIDQNSFVVRNFEPEDLPLTLDFLSFLQEHYPQAQTEQFAFILSNYVDEVLEKNGRVSIIEEDEEFLGLAGFIEEDEETAEIIGWYLIPEIVDDAEPFAQLAASIIQEITERNYRKIVCPQSAYCQDITKFLKWEGFSPNSTDFTRYEKKW